MATVEGSGAGAGADEDVKTAENFLLRLGTLDMKWRYSDFGRPIATSLMIVDC